VIAGITCYSEIPALKSQCIARLSDLWWLV
jgi:hypothetical protein